MKVQELKNFDETGLLLATSVQQYWHNKFQDHLDQEPVHTKAAYPPDQVDTLFQDTKKMQPRVTESESISELHSLVKQKPPSIEWKNRMRTNYSISGVLFSPNHCIKDKKTRQNG